MSTTALKLGSLAVRTLAKPIANRIKQQAREHPAFRRVCVSLAQGVHRIDMRLRLGLLRDPAALERAARKAEAAEHERRHAEAMRKMKEAEAIYPGVTATVSSSLPAPPPVTSEHPAHDRKHEKEKEKEKGHGETAAAAAAAAAKHQPRIRPLSESKAIETGANFISEAFLFAVAGSLILLEQVRSRRKEANRRDEVKERLDLLEARNRQDEERLEDLEERDRRNEERILQLEEENWRLKGGKGVFPGRTNRQVIKVHEPTPLWKAPETEGGGFWRKTWSAVTGRKAQGDPEKAEAAKVPTPEAKTAGVETTQAGTS